MDSHQIKQHLTDLVLDGREEVAIEELLAMSNSRNSDMRNSIEALSSRYQKFEREKTKGALNKENINTTSGRISQALMAIIEQLTEEDESSLQKVDLEELFRDLDELSANGDATLKKPAGRSKSTKVFSIILPVLVVVIAGILAFSGKFSNLTGSGNTSSSYWIGEWHHEMQSSNDRKVTGSLSFELSNNELTGKANYLYPDGSETTNTLTQIKYLDGGKVIEGIWKADDIQSLHGTFRFNLDGANRFDGQYTVINQEGEFYWKGTK